MDHEDIRSSTRAVRPILLSASAEELTDFFVQFSSTFATVVSSILDTLNGRKTVKYFNRLFFPVALNFKNTEKLVER